MGVREGPLQPERDNRTIPEAQMTAGGGPVEIWKPIAVYALARASVSSDHSDAYCTLKLQSRGRTNPRNMVTIR